MNMRKVWKENDTFFSENINESSRDGKAKLKFTRKLEMNEVEATYQYSWIKEAVKKAKSELETLKNSITREGLAKFQDEQRKKMKSLKSQIEEFEDLKNQYENVGIHEKTELQQQDVSSV